MKQSLIYWFSFLFLLLWMTSCGARKSDTTKTEVKEQEKTTESLEDKSNIKTDIENNSKTTKLSEINEETGEKTVTVTDEPIDNSKPASVVDDSGKKTELNNAKRTRKETTVLSNKKTKDSTTVESKLKVNQNAQKDVNLTRQTDKKKLTKEKVKKTEREADYSWILWALIVVLALRITYCIKTKTPFI